MEQELRIVGKINLDDVKSCNCCGRVLWDSEPNEYHIIRNQVIKNEKVLEETTDYVCDSCMDQILEEAKMFFGPAVEDIDDYELMETDEHGKA